MQCVIYIISWIQYTVYLCACLPFLVHRCQYVTPARQRQVQSREVKVVKPAKVSALQSVRMAEWLGKDCLVVEALLALGPSVDSSRNLRQV